jgi:hypothetical protein
VLYWKVQVGGIKRLNQQVLNAFQVKILPEDADQWIFVSI